MREQHLLTELVFPSRYEPLRRRVGDEVAKLLVAPAGATRDLVEQIAYAIQHGDEGLLCPMYAVPGTGKTTLAENLQAFHPQLYGSTLEYTGTLSARDLEAAVKKHRSATLAANDDRVIPINIDSREVTPPDSTEMAEIKRFLRTEVGARSVVLWPTTEADVATRMSREYETIAGAVPVALPLMVEGPPIETWRSIASDTIRLANEVDSLELLVNAEDYEPAAYVSIGAFLRQMSADFMERRLHLLRSTRKPLMLTILFASESADAGVLSQMTSSSRHGLLDGSALVGITESSEVGRWWAARRGLLTQTIVQLDAHALCLPPTVLVPILRLYGPEPVKDALQTVGVTTKGPADCNRILSKSDFGRHLLGERRSAYEARGNPGGTSQAAFALLTEIGAFRSGRDKELNRAVAAAVQAFLVEDESARWLRPRPCSLVCP
jgi:hypothetical protein